MKAKNSDWYKYGWSLDIKNQSWTENTIDQVTFIIKTLNLKGNERILDLACGYGRHSLEFARLGYQVTGVDLTKEYVEDAIKTARKESLNAEFIQADLREVYFKEEFDIVLNLGDGAIGYLETDEENLKIFDCIATALKPGGKHFMDICSGDHADRYFPKKGWEVGQNAISLSEFEWNKETRRMLFAGWDIAYGEPVKVPEIMYGDPTRLYTMDEIQEIWKSRKMKMIQAYSDFYGKPVTVEELQLLVYSQKLG